MKRIAIIAAVMVFASSLAFAGEPSPDRSHVKLAPEVPRQCLDTGSVTKGDTNYTCTKVDTSEVWNEIELKKFEKDIFEAYSERQPQPPRRVRIGLVVRQDYISTTTLPPQKVTKEENEVAHVERRDGYKYRYTRR